MDAEQQSPMAQTPGQSNGPDSRRNSKSNPIHHDRLYTYTLRPLLIRAGMAKALADGRSR